MITWDILISTIPHRHAKLSVLLAFLDGQMTAGTGVILFPDNLQSAIGEKRTALVRASAADYVSFVDDDDMVAGDYVSRVRGALESRPDYVGFRVVVYTNDSYECHAEHSLRNSGWENRTVTLKLRDISHLNPIRRELAAEVPFSGGFGDDGYWADAMRALGHVRTEEWLPDPPMYEYRYTSGDNSRTQRLPVQGALPPLPAYPWLTVIGPQ